METIYDFLSGGKSPIIVFDDVIDLDQTVIESFYALFWNAGQVKY